MEQAPVVDVERRAAHACCQFRQRHAADDQLTVFDLETGIHGAGDAFCAASHCSSIVKMNTSSP